MTVDPFSTEEISMCANCGCGVPEDKHDDERNITWSQIEAAAAANNQTADEAINNIEKMAKHEHEH
ncbi:MAG: hypothetical protein M3Q38_08390 [Chloroflexota bacterium]|nr:hypothetical protein [Chloroflexota bacterium]